MFKQVEIPKALQDDINKEYDYHTKDNIFHVSELSHNCILKMYLDRKEPTPISPKGKWAMYRGKIFDNHITKLFDEDQIRVSHKVPGTNYVIRGKIDAITYDANELVELKTVEFMDYLEEPREAHKNQALFYLACYDPLAKLQVLYVGMGECKCFEFVGTKSELNGILKEFDRKARLLGDALKENKPPEPMSCKECNYCGHRALNKCSVKKPKRQKQKKKFVRKE